MDERIEQLAMRQHGAFSRAQAFAAGVPRPRLDGLVRRGVLCRVFRRVYRLASVEVTPFTTAMAAVLAAGGDAARAAAGDEACAAAGGPNAHGAAAAAGAHGAGGTACAHGAVASHRLAASTWQYLAVEAVATVDVSGERLRRVPGIKLHRARLCDDEAVVLRGVHVTSPARTILDLAGVVTTRELEQALAAAERSGGARLRSQIRALLARRPRHRGSGHLRRLLAALDASRTPPLYLRSRAEEEALDMIRRARLPEPQTNVRVAGFEVDFVWPELRLAVEVDGFEFHGSPEAFHRDRDRDRALGLDGYQVLRFTWRQLTRDADATLAALAAAIARRQDAAVALRGG